VKDIVNGFTCVTPVPYTIIEQISFRIAEPCFGSVHHFSVYANFDF